MRVPGEVTSQQDINLGRWARNPRNSHPRPDAQIMGGCGSRAAHPCVRPPPRADDVAVSQWEGRGKDGLGEETKKTPRGPRRECARSCP
uniref:Uncharacterized protein n=1 Tax=Human herpesvirus 2 TaxID=10310 RepID=A0A481TB79_HHV2|nr:hypothetical protein [Human alphaherpesvirus 2]